MFEDYRSYCEIDLGAIDYNIKQIKEYIKAETAIMGVVKADAYGHGALKVVKTLLNSGVAYLAVATIDEALEIRQKFDIPVLVLGYVPKNKISDAVLNNITLTVYSSNTATEISKCAESLGRSAVVHIKIDTGMNRIGFRYDNLEEIYNAATTRYLTLEGIYTHFSCADDNYAYTQEQFLRFESVCKYLSDKVKIKYRHCCNSAALLAYPYMHLDMVRPGIAIYGINPFKENKYLLLEPALSFKTRIIHLKEVPNNEKIGYGGTYITQKTTRIATIPVGYADGYPRVLSNNSQVLVNGKTAPIVANICMDQCMVDVSDIDNVEIGTTVVLVGKDGFKILSADDLAEKANSISYEIVCGISKRIPRVYTNNLMQNV